MESMTFRKIGILGGMGPAASAKLYHDIIHCFQERYQAVQDTDYPPIVLYSMPLMGFDETGIIDPKLVLTQLIHGIKTLEQAGCDFIVMPCNTVHWYIGELRKRASVPIVSIIEETIGKIRQDGHCIVGILGSKTTLKFQLYQELLHKNNMRCSIPVESDWPVITRLILEIMGGSVSGDAKKRALSVIRKMEQQSVDAVVLGCTELPLAITQKDVQCKLYDTLQILAEAAVEYSVNPPLLVKMESCLDMNKRHGRV